MARLFSYHDLNGFVRVCLSKENSEDLKKQLLTDAYELLSKEGGAGASYWKELKSIADQYKISISALDNTVDYYEKDKIQTKQSYEQNPIRKRAKKKTRANGI